jgi:hypothetical protein
MMSKDDKKKRASTRQKMVVDLSKYLIKAKDRCPIRCIAVDISQNGMGLISFEALEVETDTVLVLKEKEISLKIKWCKPDSVRNGVFHIGLGSDDISINIVKLLEEEHLVTNGMPNVSFTQDEVSPPMTFAALRDLLATCRTTDPGILRLGRLAKLADRYNAFPIRYENTSLCVLLPKGLKPIDAAKLDDEAAVINKIFVIKTQTLKIVWPCSPAEKISD